MFVIIDIALIILSAVLMTGSFFVIERTRRTKFIIDFKIPKLAKESIIGVIYSGIFILLQVIMEAIHADFGIQIFLIGFVTLVMVSDFKIAIFSFPVALIYYLLMNNVDAAMYSNILVFASIAFTFLIVDFFIKGWRGRLITYGVAVVISFVALFLLAFPFNLGLNAKTFEVSMFAVLLFPIFESLVSYSIRVSVSANILYESVNYDFGHFYRESLKNQAIGNLVSELKIKQGFYGVLDIQFETQETEEQDKEVLEGVLTEIEKDFPLSTVLFKVDEINYGFFLPTSFKNQLNLSISNNNAQTRDSLDPLHNLNNILTIASKKFKTSYGKDVDVEIFAGIAIYGVQESSVDQLDNDAKFALKINEFKTSNRVTLFDPLMYRNKVNDSHAMQALDKSIGLDDYVSRFIPLVDIKTEETIFNYVTQINTSETEFIDEIRTYISATGMLNIFERYFAVDAIAKSKDYDGDLMIDYSVSILAENFNTKEFIRQLNDYKFKPSRLVLVSDTEDIEEHADLTLIRKHMKELREQGIRFAVKGFESSKLNMDYRLISSSDLEDMKPSYSETLIVFDLDIEDKAELAIEKGIKIIGGTLLERNVIPNKINKQSRIYIEDIKSRKR